MLGASVRLARVPMSRPASRTRRALSVPPVRLRAGDHKGRPYDPVARTCKKTNVGDGLVPSRCPHGPSESARATKRPEAR